MANITNRVNEYYPHHWYEYGEKYKDWIKLKYADGILEVRLHTDDGPLKWSSGPQAALDNIFYEINHDPDVEVVIITGTGEFFMEGLLSPDDPRAEAAGTFANIRTPYMTADYWYHYQTQEPLNIMNLQVPVIAAVNGPQMVHPEITLCSDIVLASDNAKWMEFHYAIGGNVPGDGAWPIWRTLIGHNRARAMMFLGDSVTAQQLYEWGVVYEVMPLEELNGRAWYYAYKLLEKPRYARRMTRSLLSHTWKELFLAELETGLAHEGYATVCDSPYAWKEDEVKRFEIGPEENKYNTGFDFKFK